MITISKSLKKTFQLLKNKQVWLLILFYIALSVAFMIPLIINLKLINSMDNMEVIKVMITPLILQALLTLTFNYTIIKATNNIVKRKKVNAKELIIDGFKKLPGMTFLSIILIIIYLLGLIALIFPAIILNIIFIYSFQIYVLDNKSITETISKAWSLGTKNFWRTFVLLLTILLISIPLMIISMIPFTSIIITPIISVLSNGMTTIYYLKGLKK